MIGYNSMPYTANIMYLYCLISEVFELVNIEVSTGLAR